MRDLNPRHPPCKGTHLQNKQASWYRNARFSCQKQRYFYVLLWRTVGLVMVSVWCYGLSSTGVPLARAFINSVVTTVTVVTVNYGQVLKKSRLINQKSYLIRIRMQKTVIIVIATDNRLSVLYDYAES